MECAYPQAFSKQEWEERVIELDGWLRHGLPDVAEEMYEQAELMQVDRVADLYELEIDDTVWLEAELRVWRNERERHPKVHEPRDYKQRDPTRDVTNEQREIEALFSSLLE